MSGFEGAAGVAGLLSLSLQLAGGLIKYYQAWSSYDDIENILARLARLYTIICSIQDASEKIELKRFEMAGAVNALASHLEAGNQKFQECLENCKAKPSSGSLQALKVSSKRAFYPFRRAEILDIQTTVDHLASDLLASIGALQL